MDSKKRPSLQGMGEFGARLREVRIKAGISQMKLAEKLGLNPTHGYKYILRLEKGLVPNPTLRTITGFLNACGATWRDVADVLPKLTLGEEREEMSEPVVILFQSGEAATDSVGAVREPPLRVFAGELFWQLVKRAEDKVSKLFRFPQQPPASRRGYLSFLRSVCTVIRVVSPDAWSGEFSQLLSQFVGAVREPPLLDEKILTEIQKICLEVFAPVIRQSEER